MSPRRLLSRVFLAAAGVACGVWASAEAAQPTPRPKVYTQEDLKATRVRTPEPEDAAQPTVIPAGTSPQILEPVPLAPDDPHLQEQATPTPTPVPTEVPQYDIADDHDLWHGRATTMYGRLETQRQIVKAREKELEDAKARSAIRPNALAWWQPDPELEAPQQALNDARETLAGFEADLQAFLDEARALRVPPSWIREP
jgi:hypothetical protein